MGERKLIQHRCLAVQLVKKESPISSPGCGEDSSSGDTTTPVNDPATATPAAILHQDGHHLFQVWQAANVECTWDKGLVEAAKAVQYQGHLVGGVVLVGGPASALATLSLAWSRSLLAAPAGYSLTMLGEVQGWSVTVVPQGQFTPLADALCWVVHHLTREGCKVGAEAVREALEISFPTMMAPSLSHVHATLSSLIQQCKVFYTGATYGIVHPGTYFPTIVPLAEASVLLRDGLVNAAAQTDLAELITGAAHASDTVISPTLSDGVRSRKGRAAQDTVHLSHQQLHHNHHRHSGRAASLRLSPTRASLLASHFADAATPTVHTYHAQDFSDISIRGERGSVFSKLLRVPGRRRIASFAAQFPPPEWSSGQAPVLHLHSVAVQTSTQQVEVKGWHWSASQWTPRSATLPRRLRRPQSSTPPLPNSQQASPVPRGLSSLIQAHTSPQMGAVHSHNHTDKKCRSHKYQSPVHQRSETRSYHSSSSEDIANNRQLVSAVIQNFRSKGNQSGKACHKNKEPGVVCKDICAKVSYNQQSVDPSKSEERLLEMLQDSHVRTDRNEFLGGRQKSRHKQEKAAHKCAPSHPPHHKHAKSKKYKPPEGRVENNQQAGNSRQTPECQVEAISQDDTPSSGKEKASKKTGELVQTDDTPSSGKEKASKKTGELVQTEKEKKASKKIGELVQTEKEKEKEKASKKIGEIVQTEKEKEKEKASKKIGEIVQTEKSREKHQYQRKSLHLDLTSDHMNNCRKVVASPQRPHDLTTNLLHQTANIQHITKGSTPDLTSRNLGYQDVDKCHKKMCTQTLDQVQRQDPPILQGGKQILSPGHSEGEAGQDKKSVSTYPSLSELNFTFSSLAAQKILSGASVNSLDTLAEVNLAALKRNTNTVSSALTNTDLGFV